ncbi:Crp/Fnr family transcriptional regulator [Wenzhouxiangella sp. AB-CW3]|uniref:Crp/Fnr family transcriptional regulator n=1 Tax=Wenzhouxiangella sp. AB-CW3 TaxID=2771012 RepID=UPI00168AB46B|nr:Crp/Fnr family transcriptional regulator [Wenzhouxiangella sp. AB-CW3]QOC21452.1 Crp/Fnr family transcriptional regulator [Wenzhouxiangella sp. AB-CW3]
MKTDSCITSEIGAIVDLSQGEVQLLEALERDPRSFDEGEALWEAGVPAQEFYTLTRGWACSMCFLSDGERQVLELYLPGQIMGLREIGLARTQSVLVALTEIEACPFPRHCLTAVFQQSARLAQLLFLFQARQQSMITERIVSIGRRPATERLAHFILEVKSRLATPDLVFDFPLRQNLIGDVLGLSSVHVSRTLSHLKEDGLMCISSGRVEIKDLDGLIEFCDFNRAYLEPTHAWPDDAASSGRQKKAS